MYNVEMKITRVNTKGFEEMVGVIKGAYEAIELRKENEIVLYPFRNDQDTLDYIERILNEVDSKVISCKTLNFK